MADQAEETYEIERICGHRGGPVRKAVKQYFIKWVGYDHDENTWEDAANLEITARDTIGFYWYAKLERKKKKEKELLIAANEKLLNAKIQSTDVDVGIMGDDELKGNRAKPKKRVTFDFSKNKNLNSRWSFNVDSETISDILTKTTISELSSSKEDDSIFNSNEISFQDSSVNIDERMENSFKVIQSKLKAEADQVIIAAKKEVKLKNKQIFNIVKTALAEKQMEMKKK